MGSSAYEEVECTTIDGIAIRGWLFAVPGPAPAIVMSHGFNCVKEMTLPDVAEWFQRRGYNVLLYDARSVGASGGVPRNQPDLLQMAEDVSDIVTFVSNLKSVDPQRILLWGMSFGGTVSGCAAAVDHRPRALIMVCPLFSFQRGEPCGVRWRGGPGGLEAYNLMRAAAGRGHPGFRDRITFQTFHKLALARPRELLDMIDERMAVMVVVPELDDISSPEEQRAAFEKLSTPRKRLHIARGKGHLSVVTGEGSEALLEAMDDFFREALRDDAG
ncbi:7b5e02a9-152d-46c9-848b-001e3a3d0024 [Thermothielavioides terrestris]|uniref:7b5e02a9-152d-46c9-848b-001e3a3d0024 n=1 Tax=Thermothielavioides terrestris TaxID=2587410 RepID=A0A446BGE9_9PEZI|nr:7b5e02a9-152d-46c9-848b-001e3a3d0024 [Thermothielavioides terrestris]